MKGRRKKKKYCAVSNLTFSGSRKKRKGWSGSNLMQPIADGNRGVESRRDGISNKSCMHDTKASIRY